MRILCVEDNEIITTLVKANLQRLGFTVDVVGNAEDALSALAAICYDALVLDLNLPDADGLAVLQRLRAAGNSIPVLILSARHKSAERIAGLNAGADDYLPKPFAVEEVAARLRALLRRPSGMLSVELRCGNLAFRPDTHTARVGGAELILPRREASVLEHLLRNAGRPVAKSAIADRLYAFGEEIASNAVEVHVHFLRKRLAAMGATARIETLRGIGYVLCTDEEPTRAAGGGDEPQRGMDA